MGKQTETLSALQKLVTALKSQITLTKEEGDLKLKEETHKRIESAKSFEVSPKIPSYALRLIDNAPLSVAEHDARTDDADGDARGPQLASQGGEQQDGLADDDAPLSVRGEGGRLQCQDTGADLGAQAARGSTGQSQD